MGAGLALGTWWGLCGGLSCTCADVMWVYFIVWEYSIFHRGQDDETYKCLMWIVSKLGAYDTQVKLLECVKYE